MKATPSFAALPTFAVLVSACILALSPVAASSARAADLDGESYAEPPYDDSTYGYDEDGAPDGPYADARDREPYDAAEPLPGSVKDGYPVPVPPPQRYGEERERVYERVERRHARVERPLCLSRSEIRRRLADEGWHNARAVGGHDGIVRLEASRFDSSSIFHLRVDRCSGEVLAARPSHGAGFAYGERPWRSRY